MLKRRHSGRSTGAAWQLGERGRALVMLAAGALAGWIPVACFNGADAQGLPCEIDAQCGIGQACIEGVCGGRQGDPACGDFVVDDDEECDLGSENSPTGDCTPSCMLPACGDGFLQVGEECDDGDTVPGDGCSPACLFESCGDGVMDAGEECDQGSANNDEGDCTTLCTLATCGDGWVHMGVEPCDPGEEPSASCDVDCTVPMCGDGLHNPAAGEACDPGEAPDSAQCASNCTVPRFFDDVEDGNVGWTVESLVVSPAPAGVVDWSINTMVFASGSRAWKAKGQPVLPNDGVSDVRLISPVIDLRGAQTPVRLSLMHRYEFDNLAGEEGDGGIVELSVEGGPWMALAPDGDYPGTIASTGCGAQSNPLQGQSAYVGTTNGAFVAESFDLSTAAGQQVRLGFRVAHDCGNQAAAEGWFIDDFMVLEQAP